MATQVMAVEQLPAHFDDAQDVYAALGEGDCMVPLIAANATLAFDKREPVRPGDIVVLWFTAAAA
jgi:phage repressor protein C with HTH and peptisase S24 domain